MATLKELKTKRNAMIGLDPENEEDSLNAVTNFYYLLQYLKEKTPKIYAVTVKRNELGLKYVEEKSKLHKFV